MKIILLYVLKISKVKLLILLNLGLWVLTLGVSVPVHFDSADVVSRLLERSLLELCECTNRIVLHPLDTRLRRLRSRLKEVDRLSVFLHINKIKNCYKTYLWDERELVQLVDPFVGGQNSFLFLGLTLVAVALRVSAFDKLSQKVRVESVNDI